MKKFVLFVGAMACVGQACAQNYILDSSNGGFSITNFRGSATTPVIGGLPLGTVGSTATGELGLKTIVISGGGGGGGASTIANGADVTQGNTTDAATIGTGTVNAHARQTAVTVGAISAQLPASLGIKTAAASFSMAPASDAVFSVSGGVTANAGTNLNTSSLALESGNLATIAAAVVVKGALTDRSGTITTGGTAQQIAAGNATRNYLLFQNNSTEAMWIDFGTAAVAGQPSIKIAAGGDIIFENRFIPNGTISVIAATTGSAWTAKEN